MDNASYVYTMGMTESEIDEFLRDGENGVLGLAADDDAYAIPLSYHYDGERLLLRVSEHGHSEKGRYIETTDTATFVRFDASTEESSSVQVRGPLERWSGDVDEATLNEWFPPFRLYDEAVEDVEFVLYELRMEEVTGRRTVD